ncbi:hypothetical protein JL720_16466 [Aureococcus anophagefferens]|nr:hypothetical protein JL720_16466 [Aureococcus anophagefferens]
MKFCGYDAYGHPVITETVHETPRANLADEDPEDLLKGRTVCTEAFIALKHLATRRHNSDVTVLKQVLIVDMDRALCAWSRRVRSRFKVIMKTLEDVYPEVAWRTYVVKSWLHPTTAMKVRILGTDRDFARAQMLADGVPEDAVPASCGGGAVEVSLADLFAGSPELAASTAPGPRPLRRAPPRRRARKAPSDAKKAELAAEAAASTTGAPPASRASRRSPRALT